MHTPGMTCLAPQALAMEPLVFSDEWLYVPGRSTQGQAFVLLGDRRLEMRPMSMRVYREERERTLRPIIMDQLKAALPMRRLDQCTDPVVCFLSLAAAASEIDVRLDGAPVEPRSSEEATARDVLVVDALATVSQFPLPQWPAPSLLLLGQSWPLERQQYARGRLQVRMGNEVLGISGRPIPLARLDDVYQRTVTAFVEQATDRFTEPAAGRAPAQPGLEHAKQVVRKMGFIQDGDLILIAGRPPLIGCLLPPHHNSSFGRPCDGNMAVTYPLALPLELKMGGIGVAERFSTGRWRPAHPPHGLCCGETPVVSRGLSDKPGLALVALLRCLSTRFAQNGKFHVSG